MNIDIKKYSDDIVFLPLGGTDQIGVNFYLFGYKKKWLIVDFGLGFAHEDLPGVEIIVPDITFLESVKKDVVGLVVTHAHEDHIGAIQYLWPEIGVPIFATPFTSAVLKTKLTDTGIIEDVTIHEMDINESFGVGPFDLELVSLTHSIPEMHGLLIKTDKGSVFHTADWKIDHNPIIGEPFNKAKLKAIGDAGVIAMVCDSTNIFSENISGSEGDLRKSLHDIVASVKKGLVVVTTFASNVARLDSLMAAADKLGKKVVFAGTSLWRMYHAAIDCNYLTQYQKPYHSKELARFKRDEVLVIATGCQGEPFAAVTKMSRNDHPDIKLSRGDTVIFASRIIPGNEMKIFGVFNKFCKSGVEVMTEKDHFIHVSGHPSRAEVKEMYELIRPKFAIPMHGEPMHIHEHCKFVKQHNLASPVQVENGKAVVISPNFCEVIGHVPTGLMVVDGNQILPSDSEVIKMRRRMRDNGLVVVTVVSNSKGVLLKAPEILTPGLIDAKQDSETIDMLCAELRDVLQLCNLRITSDVETKVRQVTRKFLRQEIGKEPKIIVQQVQISTKGR